MALVLLRLKLAVQRRSFGRSGGWQRAGLAARWLVAALLGVGAGASVAVVDSARSGVGDLALLLALTAVFIGWVLGPVLMPGISDETVNPAMLEQYPITAGEQVAGLLLGALASPTALFTFLLAAGGTFAAGEVFGTRIAVVVSALLFTLLCVVASRSIQAVLSGFLGSRRGRDVVFALGGVLGLAVYLLSQGAHDLTASLRALEGGTTEAVLSWFPPGAAGQVLISARDGEWLVVVAHVAVVGLGIGLFLALWLWGLRRRVTGSGGGTPPVEERRSVDGFRLVPAPLSTLGLGTTIAVASQQLRYYFFRSARATQAVVLPPVLGAVAAYTAASDMGLSGAAVAFAFMASISSSTLDLFGFDDRGFAYLVGSGAPMGHVLRGKVAALAIFNVPTMALVLVVLALILGAWGSVLLALVHGGAVLVAGLGVGAFVSVRVPLNKARPSTGSAGSIGWTVAAFVGLGALVAAAAVAGVLAVEAGTSRWVVAIAVAVAGALVGLGLGRIARVRLTRDPWRVMEALGV